MPSLGLSGLYRNRASTCTLVFLCVFTALYFLKSDFIMNGIIIGDDLTLHWRVKTEGLTGPHPTLPIANYLYNLTASLLPSISYQILTYLIMTSITSIFVFLWLDKYFIQNWILVSGILFSFTTPAVTSVANFVSGSHGMVGFMFASLGLLLSSRASRDRIHHTKRIALAMGAGVSFILASLSSPFLYIFFLSSVFLIFVLYRRNSCNGIAVGIIILLPSLLFLSYNLIWNSYHYNNIEGWTNYSALHILERAGNYMEYTIDLYGKNSLNLWLSGGTAMICIVLLWITIKINPINPTVDAKEFSKTAIGSTINFLVILSGFTLTLIPIFPATNAYMPRYLFPSMIMMTLIPFAVVDLIARIHPEQFHRIKKIFMLFICGLLGYNFSTTYSFSNERYGSLIRYQPMLANFIENESTNWAPSAQIIIVSNIPEHFTAGYNHWSTGFLRTHTEDETIVGLIGREKWMMDDGDPFVEFYRHHHQQYWKTVQRDGRPFSTRRRMVGLIKSRPTYAYRFDAVDGTVQRVHWLLVNASDSRDLWRITDEGIVLHRNAIIAPTDLELDRLGINEKDVFVYGETN